MTGVDNVSDDILRNIFSRLRARRMGQCRCVSKRWNALISDPNFMMSRSSQSRSSKIFLETRWSPTCILTLDKCGEPVKNLDISKVFKLEPRSRYDSDRIVTIVGTFMGIILLVVTDMDECDRPRHRSYMDQHLILYNPFTGEYEILDDPYSPFYYDCNAYGFGYGATTPEELKIVRFKTHRSKKKWNACDVFNLKTRSWSQLSEVFIIQDADFEDSTGTFLKGYLYWMNSSKIMALNVDKMVFSYIRHPDSAINKQNYLGTCHGCLWMITNTVVNALSFDAWVMKEQGDDNNSWSKVCSLAIGLKPQDNLHKSRIIGITNDGRIIIFIRMTGYQAMIIYDTSKHSYKRLESPSEALGSDFIRGIEYQESLTSPMNICRV